MVTPVQQPGGLSVHFQTRVPLPGVQVVVVPPGAAVVVVVGAAVVVVGVGVVLPHGTQMVSQFATPLRAGYPHGQGAQLFSTMPQTLAPSSHSHLHWWQLGVVVVGSLVVVGAAVVVG